MDVKLCVGGGDLLVLSCASLCVVLPTAKPIIFERINTELQIKLLKLWKYLRTWISPNAGGSSANTKRKR
jgi:hypothetical protein